MSQYDPFDAHEDRPQSNSIRPVLSSSHVEDVAEQDGLGSVKSFEPGLAGNNAQQPARSDVPGTSDQDRKEPISGSLEQVSAPDAGMHVPGAPLDISRLREFGSHPEIDSKHLKSDAPAAKESHASELPPPLQVAPGTASTGARAYHGAEYIDARNRNQDMGNQDEPRDADGNSDPEHRPVMVNRGSW